MIFFSLFHFKVHAQINFFSQYDFRFLFNVRAESQQLDFSYFPLLKGRQTSLSNSKTSPSGPVFSN